MSKRKVWGSIGGSLFGIALGTTLLLHHWTQGGAIGTVTVGNPTAHHQDTLQPVPQAVHVDTSYFTATLPAGFVVKRSVETPGQPTLLQFSANTDSKTDETFGATYGVLPAGGLTELGAYTLRAKDTATYAPATLPDLPSGAVAFRTISGPAALTVLLPHGNNYLILALTTGGAATQGTLQTTYGQIVSAWDWK